MKRLIFVGVSALLCCIGGMASGQEPQRAEAAGSAVNVGVQSQSSVGDEWPYIPEGEVIVYGIDFSKVQIYGARESAEQFANAFVAINALFVSQPDKYDCSKLSSRQCTVFTYPTDRLVGSINWKYAMGSNGTPRKSSVEEMVANYRLPNAEGIGLVFIAWLYNKPEATAYYDVVYFDIKTRRILFDTTATGRASGFSLRNYWANSIYDIVSRRALRKQIEQVL